jgi:hypothetical protein
MPFQPTHGLSHTSEYQAFRAMYNRCYRPNTHNYCNYGGRGITICDRWLNNFEAFYEDMGPKPSPQHSLDRINNNENYSPSNCRWATALEQIHNRRRTAYSTEPNRYIYPTPANTYHLVMCLPSGFRFAKTYKTLSEAEDMRSLLEDERAIYHMLTD